MIPAPIGPKRIAQALEEDQVHLTAEEVPGIARSRLPEVSLATVCNALSVAATVVQLSGKPVVQRGNDDGVIGGVDDLVFTPLF